uniref:Uncharacterized protein n=1 Tax=Rhizophora mucronata TaxID=61149 RepID=A0A2P2NZ44_RHIMU
MPTVRTSISTTLKGKGSSSC